MKKLLSAFAATYVAAMATVQVSVAQLIPIDPATGVTASSQIGGGFDRMDDYIVDGSGLTDGEHTNAPPDGQIFWLSTGTCCGGTEDLDPSVTFDLGEVYTITNFHVWNYNEINLPGRGVNEVTVEYGTTEALGSTLAEVTNFEIATGEPDYTGEEFDSFAPFSARFIKFDIDSNHGGDNQFYGLSEVQFFGTRSGILVSPDIFPTSATMGTLIGTLSTPAGDANDVFSYALVAGEGDSDNDKFQIVGDELQAGAHDFSPEADGTAFSVRVQSTGSPSGDQIEGAITLIAEADSDSDNLPDEYELMWAEDLDTLSGLDGADADGDGLTDLEEFNLADQFPALDPTKPDSDGDTLEDGAEIAGAGARPATDPTNPDTDGDNLTDGVETNTGTFVSASDTGTDPTKADTDGDGRSDGIEVDLGSDPNDPNSLPGVACVGLWTFDGNTDDSSGNANHGTLENGATLSDDVPAAIGGGQSLLLEGGEQHVLVPDAPTLSLTSGITISAWVKPADTTWGAIIAKNPQDGGALNHAGNYELRLNQDGLNPSWLYESGALNSTLTLNDTTTSVPVDEWTHLALTMDSSNTYIFYVNGEETTSDTRNEAFGVSVNSNPLYIGSRADFFTTMNGQIDEVLLFDDALAASQIEAIMGGDYSDCGIGGEPFQVTELDYDSAAPETRLVFASKPGRTYAIEFSFDLVIWNELDDGVESEGDRTTFTDDSVAGSAPDIYYRVREL